MSVDLHNEVKYFKFAPTSLTPLEFDVNTLSGHVEYTLSSSPPDYTTKKPPHGSIIYEGTSLKNYYNLDTNSPHFSVGKMIYLTIKGTSSNTRAVIAISHVGEYKMISDATP